MQQSKRKGHRRKYSGQMPRELYIFFKDYDGEGLPSFTKFAKNHGLTTEELESFRRYSSFDRAYRECLEIRRDLIIDRALSRKFDGSVSKLLLTESDSERVIDDSIKFTLKVVENEP